MSKPTDIDSIFADLVPPTSGTPTGTSTTAPTTSTPIPTSEAELFKDLENLTASASLSRPVTPRPTGRRSVERPARASGEYARREVRTEKTIPEGQAASGQKEVPQVQESERNQQQEKQQEQQQQQQSGGGGWWGGLWNTASTAIKTAEGVAKQIQASEEGKKWVEQVKGNVGYVRELGGELRNRALPSVTTLLHTLAPPISEHEQLRIHLTHDMQGYPTLDTIVFGVFERVMQQVEGGSLMVVQKGGEARPRTSLPTFAAGPWWKTAEVRNVGSCVGLQEGVKLAKANVEEYSRGRTAQEVDPENPVRKSDIYLSIQACTFPQSVLLSTDTGKGKEPADDSEVLAFAIHLLDPVHNINFNTVSQTLPQHWFDWLDAPPAKDGGPYPEVIQSILERGGMDPREWVVEWVEEAIGLSVGILAQRYVAQRMSGDDGILLERPVKPGAAEEARAVSGL